MNIVIYRPHYSIWFKNPWRRIVNKEVIPSKYEPLFEYLKSANCHLYVSGALIYRKGIYGVIDRLKEAVRLLLWFFFNKINLNHVGIVLTKKKFETMDVAFFVHYGLFTLDRWDASIDGHDLAEYLSESRVKKVVHMTHFAFQPRIGSDNLRMLKPDILVAENNLKRNSPFFLRYFGDINSDFYQLPFVPAARFKRYIKYSDRIIKLGITGTISHGIRDSDFNEYYGHGELQPLRRQIYNKRHEYNNYIDTFMYDHATTQSQHEQSANIQISDRKKEERNQERSNYYRLDIVDFYNRHAMFAVPEEVCNLPGIGFIEGMACGSAYFGIDDPMYRDLGMEPGTHYVAYNGTLENLVEKLAYYQSHLEELEVIAGNGYIFATQMMSSEVVYGAFLEKLKVIVSTR